MTYLLEIFIWPSKLCTFVSHLFFMDILWFHQNMLIVIYSKVLFMFDNLHIVNLAPRHIYLCWIMLNTKNGNRWCFETLYCVLSKFMRCFVYSWNGLFTISRTPIPKGNKLGNMHDIKDGFYYSLIILYLWL
jgi:hypothetical protein